MNRAFKVGLTIALFSLVLSIARTNQFPVRHTALLAAFLMVLRFPHFIDAGFRNSYRGLAHSNDATPPIVVQLVAIGLTILCTIVHHAST